MFTGVTGLATTVAAFIVARLCFGLSEGLSGAVVYQSIGENFIGRDRARAFGIMSTAIAIAPAFAGPFVGALVTRYGWPSMFFLMVAPALIVSAINYLLIPAWPARSGCGTDRGGGYGYGYGGTLRGALASPSLRLISLVSFAWNIAFWGYLGWMPTYLVSGHRQ